jgi:hypothetical protein
VPLASCQCFPTKKRQSYQTLTSRTSPSAPRGSSEAMDRRLFRRTNANEHWTNANRWASYRAVVARGTCRCSQPRPRPLLLHAPPTTTPTHPAPSRNRSRTSSRCKIARKSRCGSPNAHTFCLEPETGLDARRSRECPMSPHDSHICTKAN